MHNAQLKAHKVKIMQATTVQHKVVHAAIRTAARTAAVNAGAVVYKVYAEKRTSKVKSNICGATCKLFVNKANNTVLAAVQNAVKQFGCNAVLAKNTSYNSYVYIKVLRNV